MGVLASLLIGLLCLSPAYAEQKVISQFLGLNNNESSAIIGDNEAQDLLNVDITPNGKSVKKRQGYGLYKALGTAQAIHGGHHFYNSGGSDVQVWGSSTSLYGITSDATPVQIVSSATLNTTWDCTDIQGFAYCATAGRDLLLKTDGATITQWMTSPLGTMVTSTPDRLVVAGVSGARNSLYFSQANTFNNFTTGINEADPFIEVIGSQGGAITHIAWGCQKLLWWKNASFGYINGSDQTNLEVITINDNIGTVDNSSSIDPGGTVWFRGQDGHIYSYDCSALAKESIDITPLAQASGSRTGNSWTQTTQSDFQTGVSSPTGNLSFTISPNDVVPSSFTATDTTNANFNSGTLTNLIASGDSIIISTSNTNISNNGFESGSDSWTLSGFSVVASAAHKNCTISPHGGSALADLFTISAGAGLVVKLQTCGGTDLATTNVSFTDNNCTWTSRTLSASGQSRKSVRIAMGAPTVTDYSDCFISNGTDITFYSASDTGRSAFPQGTGWGVDDFTDGRSSITVGSFASQSFNTALSSSGYVYTTSGWTASTVTPSFIVQQATSSTGSWSDLTTSTGTNVIFSNQYLRYLSTFTYVYGQNALSTLDDATFLARSSGSYYSSVKAVPLLTAWDTFTGNKQDNGGTHTFYIRSGTNTFSTTSSTPTWVSQTIGGLVAASTGTFFQVRDDFAITTASHTPTLNDFTVNWFEGTASDKAYSIYFDNAIWWSVAYGAGVASNNYIFKFDLINKGWLLYDIGTGGMLQQGQYLYFGSTTTSANTYKYGSGTSDNGTAITSYYRSKDFMGGDPWLENQYTQIDSYYKVNSNQNLTLSYFLNTSTTSTSYNVNLSSNTQSVIRNKKLLPNGKIGGNISIKFGDATDSSAWELLGYRLIYTPLSYRPSL